LKTLPPDKRQEVLESFNQMIDRLVLARTKVEVTKATPDVIHKESDSIDEVNWEWYLGQLRDIHTHKTSDTANPSSVSVTMVG